MKEFIVKKCKKCGSVLRTCVNSKCEDCQITCCEELMETVIPNSVDAAIEKHVPTYEIVNNEIIIKVNHVMEEEHFIEWITIINEDEEVTTSLKPGMEATMKCDYVPGTVIYAYCNKHGLWKAEVK